MSMKKKLFISLLSLTIPIISIADPLTIINTTNQDSTSVLNGGPCSDILGEKGITRAHRTNVVDEDIIKKKACKFNKINCKTEVHMTNNCSGPVVAIVILDVNTGIKSVQVDPAQGYNITGNRFTALIEGGPAHKNWFQRMLGL